MTNARGVASLRSEAKAYMRGPKSSGGPRARLRPNLQQSEPCAVRRLD